MSRKTLGILFIALLMGLPQANAASLKKALEACATVQDNSERLVCFDGLVNPDAMSSAVSTVSTVSTVSETSAPPVGATQSHKVKRIDKYAVVIDRCQLSKLSDRTLFVLKNGDVWRQTNNRKLSIPDCKSIGSIEKRFFGYKLFIESANRSVGVSLVR